MGNMKIIVLLALLAVSVRVVPAAMAQKADSPRVSATDSYFLSCTVWTGHDWTKPTERSARTQVLVSPNGLRAYGQVSVAIKDGSCENTTTLNVASNSGQAFRVVYTKSPANSAYSDGAITAWAWSWLKT